MQLFIVIFIFFFLLHEFGDWVACQLYTHFSALLRPLTHLTRYTNLPRSFSAMHFFQILNKASARHPAIALLPSFCFQMRSKAIALSRLQRKSSSRFCGIFAAGISSFGPSSRQQVPRHHLCLQFCHHRGPWVDDVSCVLKNILDFQHKLMFQLCVVLTLDYTRHCYVRG